MWAVTVFVSCAWIAPIGRKNPAIKARASRELRIRAVLINEPQCAISMQALPRAVDHLEKVVTSARLRVLD
jgi:hypothetical protein